MKLTPRLVAVPLILVFGASAMSARAQENEDNRLAAQEVVPEGDQARSGDDAPQTRQGLLLAKRWQKALRLEPYEVSSGERRVLSIEKTRLPQRIFVRGWHGIRPVFGGAPQGAGFLVFGLGYTYGLDSERFRFDANARTSTNRYNILDGAVEIPTGYNPLPFRIRIDGSWRDLRRINFFGIGNDSPKVRTLYRQKDAWGRARMSLIPARWLDVSYAVQVLSVRTLSGAKDPSLEDLFDPATVPGFGVGRSDYLVYGGEIAIFLRDREVPSSGLTLRFESRRYDDADDRFGFVRLIGSATAHIPLGYRNRVLAMRIHSSHSNPDAGQEVPFYLMEPVGGSRTARGFQSNRFRDLRNLQVNFEYRWEVWTYLQFALFYDLLKVFPDSEDLDFRDMKAGYGWGARINPPGPAVLRFEVSHSEEGFNVYFSGGDVRFW